MVRMRYINTNFSTKLIKIIELQNYRIELQNYGPICEIHYLLHQHYSGLWCGLGWWCGLDGGGSDISCKTQFCTKILSDSNSAVTAEYENGVIVRLLYKFSKPPSRVMFTIYSHLIGLQPNPEVKHVQVFSIQLISLGLGLIQVT